MAKRNTLLDRSAATLSDSEKAIVAADKAIVSALKRGDSAFLSAFARRITTVHAVMTQTGEGEGKRFNGAAGHDFDAQVSAYASTVIRGNIPTVG